MEGMSFGEMAGYATLAAFLIFLGYKLYKNKTRPPGSGGGGGGSGGDGNRPQKH